MGTPLPHNTSPTTSTHRHSTAWSVGINRWCERHLSPHMHIVILAITTGIATGIVSYLFRLLIGKLAGLFEPHIRGWSHNWWLPFIPVAGILLTGIFTRYVIHTDLTHGGAQLIHALKDKCYRLKANIMYSPVIGGTLTLGMGGSSGSEGPIAYTGAAIGSNIGQFFGIASNNLKILMICGAAAGISAVFMAPVGGLMYALELLCVNISAFSVLAVMASCLTSFIVVYLLRGSEPYFHFHTDILFDTKLTPFVVCLGIFCGIYSLYYSSVINHLDSYFKGFRNQWARNLTGGLIVGIIVYLFPSMFSIGYDILQSMVDGDTSVLAYGSPFSGLFAGGNSLIMAAAGILICKSWAVIATNGSGGVGGDFAPTLFAGGMAGFLFATVSNTLFATSLPVPLFVYLGMAGVMSGAIHTPLMAIFIVMEFSRGYDFILPLCICSISSFLTMRIASGWSINYISIARHIHWFEEKGSRP
ncbi:MAG: chloride channel protein [Muribaculaceae bacterium]|nr:chloride channel protein [Muribaculaceae bacterium]MDE6532852.1 chloride channel protein [Muribaculaceae bacterium]